MASDEAIFALIRAMGMMSDNMQRQLNGFSMAYDYSSFCGLIEDARDAISKEPSGVPQ